MTLIFLYQSLRQTLKSAGIDNPDLEASWLLKDVLGLTDADLIAGIRLITPAEQKTINAILTRRLSGEPLSRILGRKEFYGRVFRISPAVLDPRPDTETLIDRALALLVEKFHVKQSGNKENVTILDLGTGSGCIPITLLAELPGLIAIATDISPAALEIARQNATSLGVADRIRFIQSDWYSALEDGGFDLITSNPPYIRASVIPNLAREVRNHDPILALDGGSDGLDAYKKILSGLSRFLKPGGKALLEIGFDQAEDLRRLSRESRSRPPFHISAVLPDIAGRPRVVEITCGDN